MTKPASPTQPMDTHDYVHELTARHHHHQHYTLERGRTTYGQNHTLTVPPLLFQLHVVGPSRDLSERESAGYGSSPAGRVEAVDTLARIDDEAARWVRRLGHDDPGNARHPTTGHPVRGTGTARCILLLGSLHRQLNPTTRTELTRDIRRWWTWARVVSGWDSPAWRPDNTCPVCEERRTLRVNLTAQVAYCVHDTCRETWDASNIGLLANHIREESEHERVPPPASVPCQCPLPKRQALAGQGRWGLCPTCGSPVCVNAEAVAVAEQTQRDRARELARLDQLDQTAANYQRWLRARRRAS